MTADASLAAPSAATERVDPRDLAFQNKVLTRLAMAQGAVECWQGYVTEKYGLRPGDGVADDGTIVRASRPEPTSA